MIVSSTPPIHLTYCLNVHSGETWPEVVEVIRTKASTVRDAVAGGEPFGLGLRLSAQAGEQLLHGDTLTEFKCWLADNGFYVFTINGFPYGQFHNTAVKADVYRPDWTTPNRRDYTIRLLDILSRLLPAGQVGSISTVPITFKPWAASSGHIQSAVKMLAESAAHAHDLHTRTGRDIVIALEPEPCCLLETTTETIDFFQGPLLRYGARHLTRQYGITREAADAIVKKHVGVCFDTAHQMVEYENIPESVSALRDAGIRIGKIQLSSALRLAPTTKNIGLLDQFADGVYLHQVSSQLGDDGGITLMPDLPDATTNPEMRNADQWRVHFHVPLFFNECMGLANTSDELTGRFAELIRDGICPHIEIETYTWGVLANAMANVDPIDGIIREFDWVRKNILTAEPADKRSKQARR